MELQVLGHRIRPPAGPRPLAAPANRPHQQCPCGHCSGREKTPCWRVLCTQGSRCVEARPVGVSKANGMQQILTHIYDNFGHSAVEFEFIFAAGHFLGRDENLYSFLEGHSLGHLHGKQEGPPTPTKVPPRPLPPKANHKGVRAPR
eukprot:scaffold324988_cov31-Prasinocladus_malaysianus.AAC.1